MSSEALTWAWEQKGLTPEEKLLLLRLCDGVDMDGRVRPSRTSVALDCNLSPVKIERLVEKLISRGVLRLKDSLLYLGRAKP